MTSGIVIGREAVVSAVAYGLAGSNLQIELVVDTGFTGSISLPESTCISLRLPWLYEEIVEFADGHTDNADVYEGIFVWNGKPIAYEIAAMGKQGLLGMTAMDGNELCVQ